MATIYCRGPAGLDGSVHITRDEKVTLCGRAIWCVLGDSTAGIGAIHLCERCAKINDIPGDHHSHLES